MYGSTDVKETTTEHPAEDEETFAMKPSQIKLRTCAVTVVAFIAAILGISSIGTRSNAALVSSERNVDPTKLSMMGATADASTISRRGQNIKHARDDLDMFFKGASDPYHPTDNPDGYLVMLIAENKLMWKEMATKMEAVQASRPLPEWIFNYGDMGGETNFKQSMGNMMSRWIQAPIDPDHLRFQAGAGSVLDQLSYILADSGDGVLITGPGYPAFAADFRVYGQAVIHVVPTQAGNDYVPTREALDKAFEKSNEAGNPPRIFVICQPNNPTGTIYSKEAMQMMIDWALTKGLHVVSDEIYALSTFPGFNTTSAADIMREFRPNDDHYLGDRVHIVAGLSKDWGMSGFRVGSLFTHNEQLMRALDIVDYYQTVSSYTQFALTGIFEDNEFIDWYIAENQRRLYKTYRALEEALRVVDVPLYPAKGAIFAWADFSAYLRKDQSETELWMELFDDAKIGLTAGQSCYGEKSGMFRIVYGWPEGGPEAMHEFGRRLVQWVANRR